MYGRRQYEDNDYDPSDDIEVVDCPSDHEVWDAMDRSIAKLAKTIEKEFKIIGWRTSNDDFELDFSWREDDDESHLWLTVALKAGQTIKIGNKKITADHNMEYDLDLFVHFDGGDEEIVGDDYEYWSGRYDDYSPSQGTDYSKFTCPASEIDVFGLLDADGSKNIPTDVEYGTNQIRQFCQNTTYQLFKANSRSSWKKKGGEHPSAKNIVIAYLRKQAK